MQSSSRNGANVIWLAVHTTEGIMRAAALRDWTAWAGSSHASSDETGALLTPSDGFVPYDRAAWTLRNANPISDNIEQCGWARWTRAEWLARPKLLDATARWLAERSNARGIPLVHLSLADIKARKPGVIGHGDYTYATGDGTHTDPGPNYPWDVVITKARAYAQEDDMPLTDDEINRIAARVWGGAGAPMIANRRTGGGAWPEAFLGSLEDRIQNEVLPAALAPLQGQLAGLTEALKQVAAGTGQPVDLAAVAAAAKAGAQAALAEGVDVDVTVGGKPATA